MKHRVSWFYGLIAISYVFDSLDDAVHFAWALAVADSVDKDSISISMVK